MLYQIAVVERARKKKDKDKFIFISEWFIAEGPEQAGMKGVLENRDKIICDFDDMEILVRPF
jgi:hypothetical protein